MPYLDIIRIFSLTTLAFLVALSWTPLLTHFLYKYKLGKQIRDSASAPIMSQLHQAKAGTPTMGGILIWLTTLFLALVFFYVSQTWPGSFLAKFNFLSRPQTLLPLGALVASALVGLVDDYFNIRRWGPKGGGLTMKHRLFVYTIIAVIAAGWFYFKLGWDFIHVPFVGDFFIGAWYLPLFVFIIVATAFSVNEIDGLDGLAGGTLLAVFAGYGVISFVQGKFDLAVFCGVISGALLAFLWFNIPPARFFMGDTGAMAMGVTVGILAMLTNTVFLLPIMGLLFVVESGSVIIQVTSKKFRGKKVFLSSPIHHHLEAIGWPEAKIVMRFWVIASVCLVASLVLFLVDKGY